MTRRVAVVGKGRNCPAETLDLAYAIGSRIARHGYVTITGGMRGVMLAAVQGAKASGGAVVCIVPVVPHRDLVQVTTLEDEEPTYVPRDPPVGYELADVVIDTGLTEPMRNVVIGSTCDAMVVLDGSHGTMQELAVALDREVPVLAVTQSGRVSPWSAFEGVRTADFGEEVEQWLSSL